MFGLDHLHLLVGKALRYAWRRRLCRCLPKILFELAVPIICILFFCLLRWIHTPSVRKYDPSSPNSSATELVSTALQINTPTLIPQQSSIKIWYYRSRYQCPFLYRSIQVASDSVLQRLQRLCPRNLWLNQTSEHVNRYLHVNETFPSTYEFSYRCDYQDRPWCQTFESLSSCPRPNSQEWIPVVKTALILESLLNRNSKRTELSVFTSPCASYFSDPLFELAPGFTSVITMILVDGCILFSFHLLLHELLEEKQQKIFELLRLLSIRPLLNSLAWFIRMCILQMTINTMLIFVWKISINGTRFFNHVPIGYLILTLVLWTIQTFSRAVLLAHTFNSILKASLWSCLIYLISFWLSASSSISFPWILDLLASTWLPFYSIKRIILLLIKINTSFGSSTSLRNELVFMWCSMAVGSFLMWLLTIYIEPIRPGHSGIARRWRWPLDVIRHRKKQTNDQSTVKLLKHQQLRIEIEKLTKSFGRSKADKQLAVDQISFTLEESKIYGLIGPNGSGKTTTMEMICGLLSCDSGQIEIYGQNFMEYRSELQTLIGYCPQNDMLFSYLTVREQLEFYARVRTHKLKIDHAEIDSLLESMALTQHQGQLCRNLSGGLKRKLSILCAFVGDVRIILLDEPSSSLDPAARRLLWSWLHRSRNNRILLISSHLLDEIEELCDSILVLDCGRMRANGSILQLKERFGHNKDRLQLERIPSYILDEWIQDRKVGLIEIPHRQQLISVLERLEADSISYTLKNETLDEIFIKLTSDSTDVQTIVKDSSGISDDETQIKSLFAARSESHRYYHQAIGVFRRRFRMISRKAHLLAFMIIFYVMYSLVPIPKQLTNPVHYVISSPVEFRANFQFLSSKKTFLTLSNNSIDFEQHLIDTSEKYMMHRPSMIVVGIRVISSEHLSCYLPSPFVMNLINRCLPVLSLFSNRSISPLKIRFQDMMQSNSIIFDDGAHYLCFDTLPPAFHSSIILVSLIIIVCAALSIQDNVSGLHFYSLIHGLQSSVHWISIFLSDLILCTIWFLIVILVTLIIHYTQFNLKFFSMIYAFYLVNLPHIYLIIKVFESPVLGAAATFILLQLAHLFYIVKIFMEFLQQYPILYRLIDVIRWFLVLVFPNVNLLVLITTILRRSSCPYDLISPTNSTDKTSAQTISFHVFIMILQWSICWFLLVWIDQYARTMSLCRKNSSGNPTVEDSDVADERSRIESMTDSERKTQAVVLQNVTKYFRKSQIPVVDHLSFGVSKGSCFGLLGFNGSGKTTTFRMFVGELNISNGKIYRPRESSIGYCPQNDVLFPSLTVQQVIEYICSLHSLSASHLIDVVLSQFRLKQYQHRLISHLSGGTCRRLHLALALIGSPKLLLLDEPTAKVDPVLRAHLRTLLKYRPQDTSVIFASHSMSECEILCDRLTVLVKGRARCLGSPSHLKNRHGQHYRVRFEFKDAPFEIPTLTYVENSSEYQCSTMNLSVLLKIMEQLVEQNRIKSNYRIQLTSLEHIFLTFQKPF